MKMLTSSTILAATGALLLAASAGAAMPTKEVVKSSSGRVWVNSFNNCVVTKWDTAHNGCTAAAVAGAGLELRTVYFDFNSAALTPAAKEKLDVLAATLKKQGAHTVRIVGYADQIGTSAYNVKLSQRRAGAVAAYLRHKGGMKVNGKFEVRGLGETSSQSNCNGVKGNELKACLWRDRRVEIEVVN